MSSSEELGLWEYVRLMKNFLERSIAAPEYCRTYFDFSKRRVHIPNEEANIIIQQAYGDADDYEQVPSLRVKNPAWIDEGQLKERVLKSLKALESLANAGKI